jgi:hypothetical protein
LRQLKGPSLQAPSYKVPAISRQTALPMAPRYPLPSRALFASTPSRPPVSQILPQMRAFSTKGMTVRQGFPGVASTSAAPTWTAAARGYRGRNPRR